MDLLSFSSPHGAHKCYYVYNYYLYNSRSCFLFSLKPGVIVHIYNPSTEEMRAGEALTSQCSQLHEFQANEKPISNNKANRTHGTTAKGFLATTCEHTHTHVHMYLHTFASVHTWAYMHIHTQIENSPSLIVTLCLVFQSSCCSKVPGRYVCKDMQISTPKTISLNSLWCFRQKSVWDKREKLWNF